MKGRFTMIDNYFFDKVMRKAGLVEWKVICTVLRDTFGWQDDETASGRREEATIPIERFIKMTGAKRSAVFEAITAACKRGVIKRPEQRAFRFRPMPRANLQEVLKQDRRRRNQQASLFSESENRTLQNPKIGRSDPASESENRTSDDRGLIFIKKDQDLKHTQEHMCVPEIDPWTSKPWSDDDLLRYADDCIAEGQKTPREVIITAILRDRTPLQHKLISDRLGKIAAREARIQELKSKAEILQVETASPNWRGTPLEEVIEAAGRTVSAETIRDWFWQLRFEGISDDGAILASAPAVVRDWLERNYSSLLKHPDGRPVRLVQLQQKEAAA